MGRLRASVMASVAERGRGHPCVHADGTKILYTADPQGYGQVNIVEVPAWDALPDRSGVPGSP